MSGPAGTQSRRERVIENWKEAKTPTTVEYGMSSVFGEGEVVHQLGCYTPRLKACCFGGRKMMPVRNPIPQTGHMGNLWKKNRLHLPIVLWVQELSDIQCFNHVVQIHNTKSDGWTSYLRLCFWRENWPAPGNSIICSATFFGVQQMEMSGSEWNKWMSWRRRNEATWWSSIPRTRRLIGLSSEFLLGWVEFRNLPNFMLNWNKQVCPSWPIGSFVVYFGPITYLGRWNKATVGQICASLRLNWVPYKGLVSRSVMSVDIFIGISLRFMVVGPL